MAQYPDIITASEGNHTPYYTNSSHLPVGYTEDIFTALDIQDELQTLYTSGTVFHAFLGEKLPDWQAAAALVRKIAENYTLPYYTLSPTYSICQQHGYLSGEQYSCPVCGAKTEVYSRITGYYRPVQNWNDGKCEEFKDRKVYDIGKSVLKRQKPEEETAQQQAQREACDSQKAQVFLFTTATCPNCKMAEGFLQAQDVDYVKLAAEEHTDLVRKYGILQAPTLVVDQNSNVQKFMNVSEIRRYAEQRC